MKEPWKKTCNGKVIITLNDEKSEPTEVELPVDLNWTTRSPAQCNISVSKTVVLLSFIFILGLSTYALWKVQELESVIEEDRDFMSVIKQSLGSERVNDPILMVLEEKEDGDGSFAKILKPEPLIGTVGQKGQDNQLENDRAQSDLRSSESQYANLKSHSLNSVQEAREPKEQNSKGFEPQGQNTKNQQTRNTKNSESRELEDTRESSNSADPEEWIKPLVETFDVFAGNHPIEDQFIHNVLMKLLMPENNIQVVEFNKMHGSNAQDEINKAPMRNIQPRPFPPLPIENILMKSLLPPEGFKIFHFNEKPETSAEDELAKPFETMKMKQMLPPFESGLMRSLMGPNKMKIFQFNDQKPESSMEDDMPKITIQSIKLKLLPLPPQEEYTKKDPSMGNLEVIRLHEPHLQVPQQQQQQQQPSSEEEAPKIHQIPMHNPMPEFLPEFIMKSLMPMKNFEIIPLNERASENSAGNEMSKQSQEQERFNPLPIPLQDIIMKSLLPPPHTFDVPLHMINDSPDEQQMGQQQQQQQQPQQPMNPEVEVTKVPVRSMKISPFTMPETGALPTIMKTVLSGGNDFELVNMPVAGPTSQENQQQTEENAKTVQGRSTKLSPINVPWEMVPPNPNEPVQNQEKMGFF